MQYQVILSDLSHIRQTVNIIATDLQEAILKAKEKTGKRIVVKAYSIN